MLTDQISKLYDVIYQDQVPQAPQEVRDQGESSRSAADVHPSAHHYLNQFLDRYPPNKNIYKPEQGAIDPRATSTENARGSSTSRTVEIHSSNISNPLAPCGPSPFASMWPSRIPRMFDPVSRSKCLHNHVFGMLPEPAVARKLTKAFLEGPFHHGWPVSLSYYPITCITHFSISRSSTLPLLSAKKRPSLLFHQISNEYPPILHG